MLLFVADDETWQANYLKLKAFKTTYGHLIVNKSDKKLYEWIQTQKKLKAEDKLKSKRSPVEKVRL